jgi:DNA-binding IclR family transcriptional regulator
MFGLQLISRIELQKVALPYLYELTQITGENSALSIRFGLERVFIQEIPGRHEARQTSPVGEHMPLWFGAAGKSILASMSENDIEKVIKQLDDPQTAMTILGHEVDVRKLRQELIVIKRQGYAISVGERHPDVCAVASPIFNRNQMVVGSISLRGLLPRFNFKLAKKNASVVNKTTNMINQDLRGTSVFSNVATRYIKPV